MSQTQKNPTPSPNITKADLELKKRLLKTAKNNAEQETKVEKNHQKQPKQDPLLKQDASTSQKSKLDSNPQSKKTPQNKTNKQDNEKLHQSDKAHKNQKSATSGNKKVRNSKKSKKTKHDAAQLGLKKSALPDSILEILSKLQKGGFEAYIVGGGVRDALVGQNPKDFDAVTNATPAQVKEVFGKRCRIIGRRFLLAHVYSGRDMIEVATFRAPPASKNSTNQDGMIVRDNVWGTIEQDFARRDFSINALYYDPLTSSQGGAGIVYDFCNALGDIHDKHISFLGKTQVRIDEDPVRLLRALRFAAKLGFSLDDEVHASYTKENWAHLKTVSPHRLYDETLKLFGGGYITQALPLLTQYGAMDYLFAHHETVITPLIVQVAKNTDARINIGKSINPAFFYAALLWPAYQNRVSSFIGHLPLVEAMNKAAIEVIAAQRKITAIPKFAESFIRETWELQPRLINPKAKQIPAIADQSRFRAAFDFLLLRENSGEADITKGMAVWWQDYQDLDLNEDKEAAIKVLSRKLAHEKRYSVSMDETALAARSKSSLSLPDGQKLPARRRPKRSKSHSNKK